MVTGSPDCSILATDIETGSEIVKLENSHGKNSSLHYAELLTFALYSEYFAFKLYHVRPTGFIEREEVDVGWRMRYYSAIFSPWLRWDFLDINFKLFNKPMKVFWDNMMSMVDVKIGLVGLPYLLWNAIHRQNHKDVLVVVDSEYYAALLELLGGTQNDQQVRMRLAWKAFQHVASYDFAVS